MSVSISVRDLSKAFRPGHKQVVRAVDHVSLDVDEGEFVVILGASGSGKTTLLRCIAGLEQPDTGEIVVGGKTVYSSERRTWVRPEHRGIRMVFQSYSLWPHMKVAANIAYPLRIAGVPKAEIATRVADALSLVGCSQLADRYPSQISGGQQQRVAIARALVGGARAVLFDEPLSSVDALVREELRHELRVLQERLGFSAIYITHDQTEATVLADRIVVFSDGKILQVAPPRELYATPSSLQIAQFLGAANEYNGVVESVAGTVAKVKTELGVVAVHGDWTELSVGATVHVIFRPELVEISEGRPSRTFNVWPCTVEREHFLGALGTEYRVRASGVHALVRSMRPEPGLGVGSDAWMAIDPHMVSLVSERP